MVTLITGWVFLIASLVIPRFFKKKENGYALGVILSALATGIFVGGFLTRHF